MRVVVLDGFVVAGSRLLMNLLGAIRRGKLRDFWNWNVVWSAIKVRVRRFFFSENKNNEFLRTIKSIYILILHETFWFMFTENVGPHYKKVCVLLFKRTPLLIYFKFINNIPNNIIYCSALSLITHLTSLTFQAFSWRNVKIGYKSSIVNTDAILYL